MQDQGRGDDGRRLGAEDLRAQGDGTRGCREGGDLVIREAPFGAHTTHTDS